MTTVSNTEPGNPEWKKPEYADISNWRLGPYNRWTFHNVRELIPSANIEIEQKLAQPLHTESSPSDSSVFSALMDDHLEYLFTRCDTDCLVILHQGKKILDWSASHCNKNNPHIVFSISKSITAMLSGILASQGVIDVNQIVAHYLPGTRGSAYEDCSIQHLLDMTVSLAFEENYLDVTGDYRCYRDATGWNPVDQMHPGPSLEPFLYSLAKAPAGHGEQFNYKSPNSDLLGLLLERASGIRYADLMGSLIWQPLGAETAGYVTVDRALLGRGAGGVCVTIDDLAQIGQLMLDRGYRNHQQIIPESWIADTLDNGDHRIQANESFARLLPTGRYRNNWYQVGNNDNCYFALGIHGQWLYINPASSVVIAKGSSQPEPLNDILDFQTLRIFNEISRELGS